MTEPSTETDRIARGVIGAAIEVHRRLGPGLLEATYERALVIELEVRGLRVASQVPITLTYRELFVGELRLDLVVEDRVLVELKAVDQLANLHFAQTIAYLRAARLEVGLLINFNVSLLRNGLRRLVNT